MKNLVVKIILLTLFWNCSFSSKRDGKPESNVEVDTLYDLLTGELVHETEDTLWFEPFERKSQKLEPFLEKERTTAIRRFTKTVVERFISIGRRNRLLENQILQELYK